MPERLQPTQPELVALRERLGEDLFAQRVEQARQQVALVEQVEAAKRQGEAEVAGGYQMLWLQPVRCLGGRSGRHSSGCGAGCG